ncbi:Carboxypeptidase m [Operophtera brumata]|uniref:Carboxypeptidase m n=1 Tax=Operophtera brumata TaxID=104452 RepID=A0A0L7LNH1_OPEBR|nr:Carboxypeptidase m [Operophtera brumata]
MDENGNPLERAAIKVAAEGYIPQEIEFIVIDSHPTLLNVTLHSAKVLTNPVGTERIDGQYYRPGPPPPRLPAAPAQSGFIASITNSLGSLRQLTELRSIVHFDLVPGDLERCDERSELDTLATAAGEPRFCVRHLDYQEVRFRDAKTPEPDRSMGGCLLQAYGNKVSIRSTAPFHNNSSIEEKLGLEMLKPPNQTAVAGCLLQAYEIKFKLEVSHHFTIIQVLKRS